MDSGQTPIVDENGNPHVRATYDRAGAALKRSREVSGDEAHELMEQSLRDFIWLWEESFEHRPAFVGVRSSFMLSKFHELAQLHPPAAAYLEQELDRLESKVEQGCCTESDFHDLVSLNWKAESPARAAEAMHTLLAKQPDLAQIIGSKRWETWQEASDWELFKTYVPPPAEIMQGWLERHKSFQASVADSTTGRGSPSYRQAHLQSNQRRFEALHNAYLQADLPEQAQVLASMKSQLPMPD